MQESCPPPRPPPARQIAGGWIGAVPSFTGIRNLAALDPGLKVDGITLSTMSTAHLFPDRT